MALKKSELYSSLWSSCDALRGGMDASQYKDYVLSLLFIKYVSDKYAGQPFAPVTVPDGAAFSDMVALKGSTDIGDQINKKIVAPLASANQQLSQSDFPDFNDAVKLGDGKEKVDRLTDLVAIFETPALDFSKNRADGDDILGDAYEYLMRHFASESGKSKGQFYTPAEVSRIMAKILGIRDAQTGSDTTVYDPTCGSGSLLLKVGDEAGTAVTLYGQEKDATTSGLARMNMILHNNPTATIEQGNTLSGPKFKDGDVLKTFNYVVANPPFSDKRWITGLDPTNDPFERFKSFGVPPGKQGDYAYLLHIVRSLKSTGTGACILPHGVLFRGNAEAAIRRNLVRKGYIKGIIGLPANLFYGTGIPACIIVIDKSEATERRGIFMVDASEGFAKDGPKNRLRSQDVHKIVDVFNRQQELPGFSKLVGYDEIEKNEFNLNLPRYIDSRKAEDVHDIGGHLQGGIPVTDVASLNAYWSVCPELRLSLFADNRPGYVDLVVEKEDIKSAIYEHPEFATFIDRMNQHFGEWKTGKSQQLRTLETGCNPKVLIEEISDNLLEHYRDQPLIDAYDVYQHLMDYWADVMQDDVYQIAVDGWKAETYRILVKDKNDKEKDKGWVCDLVPKPLIVARYFAEDQAAIDDLKATMETAEAQLTELAETHGGEDGPLNGVSSKTDAEAVWQESFEAAWQTFYPDSHEQYQTAVEAVFHESERLPVIADDPRIQALKNNKGNITKGNVNKRIKIAEGDELTVLNEYVECLAAIAESKKMIKKLLEDVRQQIQDLIESDSEDETVAELRIIAEYLAVTERIAALKKQIKDADAALDVAAYEKYPELTEDEVKTLVVDDKWLTRLDADVHGEMDRISQSLTQRVKELAERYETPLPQLSGRVDDLEEKVNGHLVRMGFGVTKPKLAEVGT